MRMMRVALREPFLTADTARTVPATWDTCRAGAGLPSDPCTAHTCPNRGTFAYRGESTISPASSDWRQALPCKPLTVRHFRLRQWTDGVKKLAAGGNLA